MFATLNTFFHYVNKFLLTTLEKVKAYAFITFQIKKNKIIINGIQFYYSLYFLILIIFSYLHFNFETLFIKIFYYILHNKLGMCVDFKCKIVNIIKIVFSEFKIFPSLT